MKINMGQGRGFARFGLLLALVGALAATAWSTLSAARAQASQAGLRAALASAPAARDPGACGALPPGHPPLGNLLPPGHPPIGPSPEDEPAALPPGHPPVQPGPSSPHALPPAGGEPEKALFDEPTRRDI